MQKVFRFFLLAAIAASFVIGVYGQEIPKQINGGVLNGKAVSLPKPVYPADAKALKIGGAVKVGVTIGEGGIVEYAKAIADDEECDNAETPGASDRCLALASLRSAAEMAASQAQFTPTLLSGTPVKVKGVIVYNFVPGPHDDDSPQKGGTVLPAEGGGVLNGRAIQLPNPAYPPAAKAVGADGIVTVAVVIDEAGNVISAAATSGHPLLRAAAVAAARAAKFGPTVLEGQTVKVKGVLTYNFVLPPKN